MYTRAKHSLSLPNSLSPSRARALWASKGRNRKTLLNPQCIHPNYIFFGYFYILLMGCICAGKWCWECKREPACGDAQSSCAEKVINGVTAVLGGTASPRNAAPRLPAASAPPFLLLCNINVANANCAPGAAAGWAQGHQICITGMMPAVLSSAFCWR